jgi:N-acetylmuramoyl-L-alanine amidase
LKLRALGVASIAALSLFTIALPAQQSALPYTVVTKAGRQPLAARAMNGQDMFALDDLARIFNLSTKEDTLAGGLTVTVGTQAIVLSPQQPLASVAGRMISLPAAPVRDGRVWYVPVDFVSRALAPISPIKIDLRKASRLVLVGDVRMPRVAARAEALGTTTRVTLDVAPPTPHTVTQEGSRIVVRFDADGLDAADLKANLTSDTLQGIHVGDTPQTVTIDLGPRFGTSRSSDQPAPAGASRIVVDLVSQETPQPNQPAQPQAQPPQPAAPEPPLLDLPPAGGLRTIVIDAGHGGDDAGAKGAQGTLEKNVTLTMARRLKASIEARLGVRVLLTRDSDQNVGPDQRAALANNNKADLFVSLHANGSLRKTTSGALIYVAAFDRDAAQASAGGGERVPTFGGGSREIELVPWNLAQTRHLDQSSAFAELLQQALHDHVPLSARPIERAPLRVLESANMPAILVELGYLTNADQAKMLGSDAFQNVVAQALFDAIVKFRDTLPGGGTR